MAKKHYLRVFFLISLVVMAFTVRTTFCSESSENNQHLATSVNEDEEDVHGTEGTHIHKDGEEGSEDGQFQFGAEEPIEITIRRILMQLRNQSATKLPGVEIPDPMPIEDFDTTVDQGMTTADVQLWNATIEGLSEFIVDQVKVHLSTLYVGIGMNFTKLQTKGKYNLNGKFSFFKLSGNGDFFMNINNAYVSGNIYLNVTEDGSLVVQDVNFDIDVEGIQLNFENLLGKGVLSSFSNTIINAMSKVIFDSVKPTILSELEATVKLVLNDQFQNLPPQPTLGRSASPLDLVLANTATQIRQNNLDPFILPNINKNFSKKILFMTVSGKLSLFQGYFTGLSSIHRTGDITMSFKENTVDVSAELGFGRLEGGYKWQATLMGVTRRGGIHFFVKGVNLMFNATQENEKGSHPELTDLKIQRIEQVGLDMDGLGSFDFLFEFFSNFFTNVFKNQFSKISENQLKAEIQKNLKEIQLPF